MKKLITMVAIIIIILSTSSCSKQAISTSNSKPEINSSKPAQEESTAQKENQVQQQSNAEEQKQIDYSSIKANEAGKIMVLMYHGIGDKEEEWVRTADNFKKDLKTLYEKGYRTVSLHDYINNNINVPAGYTPVVITFDDSLQNQFNMVENGGNTVIDSNCAVDIMKKFSNEHQGFGNEATFYIYYPIPFRQKEKIKDKLEYLINNGFDVGNHSYTHEDLGKLDKDGIQKQLGLNVKMSLDYLPDYKVDTLALPYGSRPKDENLRKYIVSGEYQGTQYTNKAVLLVGSNPAPASNNKDYNPAAIPRIRASEMKTAGTGIYDWLKYFDNNPNERYISDGDSKTVVVPKNQENKLNKDVLSDKKIIIY